MAAKIRIFISHHFDFCQNLNKLYEYLTIFQKEFFNKICLKVQEP